MTRRAQTTEAEFSHSESYVYGLQVARQTGYDAIRAVVGKAITEEIKARRLRVRGTAGEQRLRGRQRSVQVSLWGRICPELEMMLTLSASDEWTYAQWRQATADFMAVYFERHPFVWRSEPDDRGSRGRGPTRSKNNRRHTKQAALDRHRTRSAAYMTA